MDFVDFMDFMDLMDEEATTDGSQAVHGTPGPSVGNSKGGSERDQLAVEQGARDTQ